jgi:hypothetical protein
MVELPGYLRVPHQPFQLSGRYLALPVALIGVGSDWVTTQAGLGMGYNETHLTYHPLLALVIFLSSVLILLMALPRGRKWDAAIFFLASWSFLGAVNNILVIVGVFGGWVI